jgi:hypothetical protein
MKLGMFLAWGFCLIGCSAANAASISVEKNPANDAYSLFLNGGAENDAFDTIFVLMAPDVPAVFTNLPSHDTGFPRPPGDGLTYHNRMLNGDPVEIPGALGLNMFGYRRIPTELSFTIASLGGTITTAPQPGGNLFLGNVNMPGNSSSGRATVQILRQGTLVQEMNARFMVPEPRALMLAACSLLGVSFIRRQSFGG